MRTDGLHVGDHVMAAAIGIDAGGEKHVPGLAEGARENTATVRALLDNLIERGLDPERPRLYIVDGAKALSKAIRRSFGHAVLIQRCQVHKGRNITDRLDESLVPSVRKALRQAWDQSDAAKAERLLRNLASRLELDAPGVSKTIQEGLDEILAVIRLGLPAERHRALARTNAIENALGTVRTEQRNVKRWRNAEMAQRWTAAGLLEAKKTFRRLKAYRQLPVLDAALRDAVEKATRKASIDDINEAAQPQNHTMPASPFSTPGGTTPPWPSSSSNFGELYTKILIQGLHPHQSAIILFIPNSLQNPKILVGYDPEVVCDGVALGFPLFGQSSAEEIEDSVDEVAEARRELVVGHFAVHDSP